MDTTYEPILISASDSSLQDQLNQLQIHERSDVFMEQVEELFEVLDPFSSRQADETAIDAYARERFGENYREQAGMWVVYPWLYRAVRVMDREDFTILRTARNRLIISENEQVKYRNGVVGVAGLSVGSSIVSVLTLTGGPDHIKIADFDTLSLTNLNRLNNSVANLGLSKAVICARRVYELNPYATVELFSEGLNEDNIENFFQGNAPLDVVFDELDSLKVKVDLRLHARKYNIPLVMVTDDADNILIDIERFDQGITDLFHGRISEEEALELFNMPFIDPPTRVKAALRIIGPENSAPRMQASLLQLGRTLAGVPQVGTATTLTGAAGAYIARRLITGEPVMGGRTHFSLDALLVPDYMSEAAIAERQEQTNLFVDTLKRM